MVHVEIGRVAAEAQAHDMCMHVCTLLQVRLYNYNAGFLNTNMIDLDQLTRRLLSRLSVDTAVISVNDRVEKRDRCHDNK